jgi:hypothetical protein
LLSGKIRKFSKLRILLFIILLVTLLCECYERIWDTGTTFLIRGEVFDKNTDNALSGVKIIFIDTGFDEEKSKILYSKEIGESTISGQINIEYFYEWGGHDGTLSKYKPKMTYEIMLAKPGFENKRYTFKAPEDARKGTVSVLLGKIYIQPLAD